MRGSSGSRISSSVTALIPGYASRQSASNPFVYASIARSSSPARQHAAAVLLRRQPAVLVDAAEDPVGLAARTATLDQVEQLSLSALAFTRPVQRERELLADHRGRRERRRHLLDELDHLRPRLHRAIGEEEVDHDLRLGVLDRREIGFDGPHRLHALAAGLRQLLLALRGVAHLIAEHVGLGAVDLRRRQPVDQLEERAVRRAGARFLEPSLEYTAHRVGIRGRPAGRDRVREDPLRGDVERQPATLRVDQHGAVGPQRVSHAELVEDVRVRGGQVGDGVLAEQQPLEHRLVDDPARLLLVGPERLEVGGLDRGRDHLGVDGVEVDRPAGPVGLLPERHQHEAERSIQGVPPTARAVLRFRCSPCDVKAIFTQSRTRRRTP